MFDITNESDCDKRLYPNQQILEQGQIVWPETWVYAQADDNSARITQYTYGEPVGVMDKQRGFLYVQSLRDAYCGWIDAHALRVQTPNQVTHVTRFNTPITTQASLKSTMLVTLPRDCLLTIDDEQDDYVHIVNLGWAHRRHVNPHVQYQSPLTTAHELLGQSYVWGGRGLSGLDCSAFSQLCYRWAGMAIPRDADLQACYLQTHHQSILEQEWQSGDLLFIPGHVMLIAQDNTVIHASGYDMRVVKEPIAQALERYKSSLQQRYQVQAYRWQSLQN